METVSLFSHCTTLHPDGLWLELALFCCRLLGAQWPAINSLLALLQEGWAAQQGLLEVCRALWAHGEVLKTGRFLADEDSKGAVVRPAVAPYSLVEHGEYVMVACDQAASFMYPLAPPLAFALYLGKPIKALLIIQSVQESIVIV